MADSQDKTETLSSSEEDILRIARERFRLAADAETKIRTDALDDIKFSIGEQWPDDVKRSRDLDRRPCLTINRLPQFIRQITNDQRQNRQAIKVSPVDDKATIETAEILQGLIRHIENSSNADTAYDSAFDSSVRAGFGYFRIITDYCDPLSFDQEIRFKRVRNRFSVYLDPTYQEPDGSDVKWGFVFEDLSKDEFKALYPDAQASGMTDWQSIGDQSPGWFTEKTCRVAEYFYTEYKEVKLVRLNNGQIIDQDQLPKELPEGLQIVDKRTTQIPQIKWCKLNGIEILDKTDWPGQWIPIVPVLGEEVDVDGVKVLEGVVRHAKDPQRMYNYWASSETELIALAPKAPFIGLEGQFEGFESQWQTANIKSHAYLEYKAKTIGGAPAPPPQRNVYEPPVQAISQARMIAADDLKSTTGIYDPALGAQVPDQSGVAIQKRNIQTQTSNFHFVDNLSKSRRHAGRIIVDLIPHIYDTARAVRILHEDDQEEIVQINQLFEHKGKTVNYDFSVGKYDVAISSGPSFETKRQEAAASMADVARSYPQLMQVAGDLMVKSLDWPHAQEIGDRIKKTLPPGIADDKNQEQQIPPQIQAQMQQLMQQNELLTAHLNDKTKQIETKSIELESRERIEMAKIQANIEIELARLKSKGAATMLEHEVAGIDKRLDILNMSQPVGAEASESNSEPNSGAGSFGALRPTENQQPTGGPSPGAPMGG